jgi:hypothetical protein
MGASYSGWLAGLAAVDAHPALKAVSPQAPMTDTWMGDDFFHQGAFRQTSGVEFAALMETDPKGFTFQTIPAYDHYEYYLRYPTLDSLARATGVSRLPSWVGYSTHPTYDAYWKARAMQRVLTKAEVPLLFVGGWWDQEDILGAQLAYRRLSARTPGVEPYRRSVVSQRLVAARRLARSLALGSKTSDYFRASILRPWFILPAAATADFPKRGFGQGPTRGVPRRGCPGMLAAPALPSGEARSRSIRLLRASYGRTATPVDPAHTPPSTTFVSTRPIHSYLLGFDNGDGWRTWRCRTSDSWTIGPTWRWDRNR